MVERGIEVGRDRERERVACIHIIIHRHRQTD